MVRHWNRALRTERDPHERARIMRSRLINGFGASLSGVVLVIVILTKFTKGAYLVLIAMPILYAVMRAINRHYTRVSDGARADQDESWCCRRATTSSCWCRRCTSRRCARSHSLARPGRTP